MPSASNNNSNTKLEKQSSVSSGSAHAGGGGGEPGNISVSPPTKSATAVVSNNSESSITSATSAVNNNDNSSTSSSKEKAAPSSGGTSLTPEAHNNPLRQTLITIEHKIRNLEKRKTKLESYRAIQASGKELSADQKAAVAKYDAVMATLDFARDLSKQMVQFAKEAEKEQKKQMRKEAIARAHAETAKIREVLVIQNILSCFTDNLVRADFLQGDNGATKLEPADLNALEKFCIDIRVHRPESADDATFINTTQKVAEFFSMTIDGRPKQYGETTFENLRRIFNQIESCGYLDKSFLVSSEPISKVDPQERKSSRGAAGDGEELLTTDGMQKLNLKECEMEKRYIDKGGMSGDDGSVQAQQQPLDLQVQKSQQQNEQNPIQQHINTSIRGAQSQQTGVQAPQASTLPKFQSSSVAAQSDNTTPVNMALFAGKQQIQASAQTGGILNMQQSTPPQQPHVVGTSQQRPVISSPVSGQLSQGVQPMAMHGAPPPANHFPPTTVRAVEHGLFKQHQQHQQFLQQMRPLAEVIGSGSFYFLQDSELDSPDLGPLTTSVGNISSVIFEQQKPQQQSQTSIMKQHSEISKTTEMCKTPDKQQMGLGTMQPTPQQISTQTFTNQSFPPIPQVAPTAVAVGAAVPSGTNNSSNTPSLSSNTPSPMFHQKHPQLFSPVSGLQQQQQLLQQQQDIASNTSNVSANVQQQLLMNEQPMMMMARLTQSRLPPQQSQQTSLSLQGAGDAAVKSTNFPFENPVTALTYEQQMQQQLAAAVGLKTAKVIVEEKKIVEDISKYPEPVVDWQTSLKNATRVTSAASNALASILKPAVIDTNKWSTEMNSVSSTTPSSSNSQNPRKSEWNTGNNGNGGYAEATTAQTTNNAHESNHWNVNQTSEVGSYGRSGGGGTRGTNNYQRRGGDERRDRDDRNARGPTGAGGNAGGNTGYRGRLNNYGSSSSQQNGGRGGGNNSGIYFRNNENSSASSQFYQNGVYSASSKDNSRFDSTAGGSYRGPRGGGGAGGSGGNGNGNGRGNAPPSRAIGRNGAGSATSATYMNPRQSNRLGMGLENKN